MWRAQLQLGRERYIALAQTAQLELGPPRQRQNVRNYPNRFATSSSTRCFDASTSSGVSRGLNSMTSVCSGRQKLLTISKSILPEPMGWWSRPSALTFVQVEADGVGRVLPEMLAVVEQAHVLLDLGVAGVVPVAAGIRLGHRGDQVGMVGVERQLVKGLAIFEAQQTPFCSA